MRLLLLLFPSLFLWSASLEACYRVFFLFIPVAESCVNYIRDGDEIRVRPWARTAVIGRLVKRVDSRGESVLVGLQPNLFVFFQREGPYVRDHEYLFREGGVEYTIVRHRDKGKEVKKGFFPSRGTLYDPFGVSLLIYLDTPNTRGGSVLMFYDEKVRKVDYRTVGEEEVEVFGRVYETWKVRFSPEMETRGLLKPKGIWYAWIDKETNIPVLLKVGFTIGSAYIYLERLKGDRRLLKEIKETVLSYP